MRDKKTYAIIGAALEVHKELGSGFLEAFIMKPLNTNDLSIVFNLKK